MPTTRTITTKVVALTALLFALPLCAQTKEYGIYEINPFGGYQWYKERAPAYKIDSGVIYGIRFGQDFARHVGIEESFTTGHNDVRLFGPPDPRVLTIESRSYQFGLNPLFYFTPRESKVRPFLTLGPVATNFVPESDVLKGLKPTDPGFGSPVQSRWGAGLMYGAGVKFNFSRRIGLRFDVRGLSMETPHFNQEGGPSRPGLFGIPRSGSEMPLQVTGGFIFHFGMRGAAPPPVRVAASTPTPAPVKETPPPPPPPPPPPAPKPDVAPPKPVEVSLSAIQGAAAVCPGDTVTLQSNATVSQGATPTYRWLVDGQPAGGNSPTFQVPTQGRTGQLSVSVSATAGGVTSTAEPVIIRLRAAGPPVVQFTVPQTNIAMGDRVPLAATATTSDCGGASTIRYTASEGAITGTTYDSATVAFDPNNTRLQTKPVTLTATATDQRGATGSAPAQVTVTKKPVARRLDDIVYPSNSSRVNNCAKRLLLEELTPLLRDDPNAKLILIGHRDPSERGRNAANLDQQRVLNAAAVLSAGTGICPQLELSRVQGDWVGVDQSTPLRPELCGTSTNLKERPGQALSATDQRAQYRRVEIWVVPEGADLPAGVKAPRALPTAQVKALSCPR